MKIARKRREKVRKAFYKAEEPDDFDDEKMMVLIRGVKNFGLASLTSISLDFT